MYEVELQISIPGVKTGNIKRQVDAGDAQTAIAAAMVDAVVIAVIAVNPVPLEVQVDPSPVPTPVIKIGAA